MRDAYDRIDAAIERRRFLLGLLAAGLASQWPLPTAAKPVESDEPLAPAARGAAPAPVPSDATHESVTPRDGAPWQSFARVLRVLWPEGGATPSAAAIDADGYLRRALDAPDTDPELRTFLLDGLGWLDAYAREQRGEDFAGLAAAEQDALLARIAGSRAGERWLEALLGFLLEALLADPVYGANPNGIGWRWLAHTPGFPRPRLGKRYWEIG